MHKCKNCSRVCMSLCTTVVHNTAQSRAQMLSIGGEGQKKNETRPLVRICAFSALTLVVWWQKGHPDFKNPILPEALFWDSWKKGNWEETADPGSTGKMTITWSGSSSQQSQMQTMTNIVETGHHSRQLVGQTGHTYWQRQGRHRSVYVYALQTNRSS